MADVEQGIAVRNIADVLTSEGVLFGGTVWDGERYGLASFPLGRQQAGASTDRAPFGVDAAFVEVAGDGGERLAADLRVSKARRLQVG